MSGICGVVNLDGAPVDRELLQAMTDSMTFRGPDAQNVWVDGNVGFGHTLLRTTFESEHEQQPFSIDSEVWITADARVDGRTDLIDKLRGKGREVLKSAPDLELILHAYHVWGEDCVQHLIGDFAFAIWDGSRQRLFCARDHFGVKPFFYARKGDCLIFSNTLNCIRVHPDVSDELNDQAIGDFLLFDYNQDPATTSFADIQRLPPAHYSTWSHKEIRLKCYWALRIPQAVHYRHNGDYIDHFRELLRVAVADRLRTNRVGVSMSGGLDSSAVAATAHSLLTDRSEPFDLKAQTVVYDRLIPDQERFYSGLVAEKLGIPIHYLVADDYGLFERWDQPETRTPEPVHNPYLALGSDEAKHSAVHSRVVLTGWDGDAVLNQSPKPYLRALLDAHKFGRLLAAVGWCVVSQRRRIAPLIRARLKSSQTRAPQDQPAYPAWINPEFAKRCDLPSRWTQYNATPAATHATRPYAHQVFSAVALWQRLFEDHDPAWTRVPVKYRHPLLDLRLVEYCLSLPPFPWCVGKELLRNSMSKLLPDPVRLRPKALLAGDRFRENLRRLKANWLDDFVPTGDLARYINRAAVPAVCRDGVRSDSRTNLRPFSLNCWLQFSLPINYKPRERGKAYYAMPG